LSADRFVKEKQKVDLEDKSKVKGKQKREEEREEGRK
jgi:hypothetical protein